MGENCYSRSNLNLAIPQSMLLRGRFRPFKNPPPPFHPPRRHVEKLIRFFLFLNPSHKKLKITI